MGPFDYQADVVVVGSGSAALSTALAAMDNGLAPLIIESQDKIGGSSAMSGGGMWIPNNPLMKEAGVADSYEEARTYIDTVIGDVGPASSPERRHAYLTEGPAMVNWLRDLGVQLAYGRGYADYYPQKPGGKAVGRALEGDRWDITQLGPWKDRLTGGAPLPMLTTDGAKMPLAFRTRKGFMAVMKLMRLTVLARLQGKQLVGLGNSLIGQMLNILVKEGVAIWTETPLIELIEEDGRIVGVVAEKQGRRMRIGATHGVMLAAGGFEHNDEMRQKYQPHPITTGWTSGNAGNKGAAILAGEKVGARLELMDDSWWGPSSVYPDGTPSFMLWERSFPHGFIVDKSGQRFMNESASYVDCGHWQYERNKTVDAIPAYLIIDSNHRDNYLFGMAMPRLTPKKLIEGGYFTKAQTLEELARKIGVDVDGLLATQKRFNAFARRGVDEDFDRGGNAYDRYYSDPRVKPNPNLGAVEKGPFYAVKVYPGDLGTKGGLLTDEQARVLREDGSVIEGLYAAGNTSASVMGHTYPGPGSTIGPAMIFGYIGGKHMAAAAKARKMVADAGIQEPALA